MIEKECTRGATSLMLVLVSVAVLASACNSFQPAPPPKAETPRLRRRSRPRSASSGTRAVGTTSLQVSIPFIAIDGVEGGKVKESWLFFDNVSFAAQLQ